MWMPRPDTTWWILFKKGKRIINVNLGTKVHIYFEWENKLWKITLNPKIQALFFVSVMTGQKCLLKKWTVAQPGPAWQRIQSELPGPGNSTGLPLTLDPRSKAGTWVLPAKGSSCHVPRPTAILTEGRGAASRLFRGLCPGDQPRCASWGASRECHPHPVSPSQGPPTSSCPASGFQKADAE